VCERRVAARCRPSPPVEDSAVSPLYFQTMGIPLLAGRDFTEQDRGAFWFGESPWTLIVNETFARRYWPNENPIGKRFRFGANVFRAVFGVVGGLRGLCVLRGTRAARLV